MKSAHYVRGNLIYYLYHELEYTHNKVRDSAMSIELRKHK